MIDSWEWLNKSEVVLLDVWGVITDGYSICPEGMNLLYKLHQHQKKVFLLSNTADLSSTLEEKLLFQGFPRGLWQGIITAGDVARHLISQKYSKSHYYLIGKKKSQEILAKTSLTPTSMIEKASFVLIAGMPENNLEYLSVIENANDIPIFCANPDIKVTLKNGKTEYCAGKITHYLKSLGFEIHYIGKPYKEIYQYFCKKHAEYKKQPIVCIGDTIETDIFGANQQGYTSVLFINANTPFQPTDLKKEFQPHYFVNAADLLSV